MNLQKPIAMAAITAMLLSNVAGWVHMGCVHSACHGHVVTGVPVATTNGANAEGAEEVCQHSCCHQTQHVAKSDFSGESGQPRDLPVPEPHDSDSCSVCQSFLTTRQAVELPASLFCIPIPLVSSWIPEWNVAAPSHLDLDGETVRGPPIV